MSLEKLSDQPLFTGDGPTHEATFRSLVEYGRPVARFDRPRATSPTTLGVVSDPHIAVDASGTWKMYHRSRERFRETLVALEREEVDALVITGDLTKDGEERNLDWMQSVLDDVPMVVVPGNHDVKEVSVERFERRFTENGFPIRKRLDGLDVLGLNSAMTPGTGDVERGVVSDAQLDWLEETLPTATDPIVVTHHNLPGLHDHIGGHGWTPYPPVGNADALLDVLSCHDVPLHLSGHVHLLSLLWNSGVRGFVAPPLSSFPQAYALLDVDASGTTVRCRTAASQEDIEEAYADSQAHSVRSGVIARLNAKQLRSLPLVDERVDAADDIRSIHRQ
ncbi:metallophosphoesterase family protein [Halomicrococcus sp. NG-SE-24]|uniref:metallophosphoesterase family protein n=1 Tax=Halomicrococcus sp. NG-SE-24 TaxID=3436928 RepID=UPI003D955DB8